MRVTTRVLAAGAAAAAAGLLAGTTPAVARAVPDQNKPSYWENNGEYSCDKVELADGVSEWTVAQGSGFVVLKAGTDYTLVAMSPFGAGTYTSEKDISFVITCEPGSTGS
ncbi:hypothetical protein [Phycicoccus flavus]|uniref:hypothetical protein n=1 Tax=Phycicoccus flavus TaxID=2502783 RepID=UPI000FEBF4B2|nr:hypothetical protein [Phycicoccus flavus]NHA67635.1 hypothetical protein [Phycicoccus flavus]